MWPNNKTFLQKLGFPTYEIRTQTERPESQESFDKRIAYIKRSPWYSDMIAILTPEFIVGLDERALNKALKDVSDRPKL